MLTHETYLCNLSIRRPISSCTIKPGVHRVTDHMPVHAQFLKIAFVHDVGMCVYVHLLGY